MKMLGSSFARRARNRVAAAVRKLPPPRDEAALQLLRSLRALQTGRAVGGPTASVAATGAASVPRQSRGLSDRVGPPLPKPPPLGADFEWIDPPVPAETGVKRSIYDTGARSPRFDVQLLDQLNEEYRDRPIVPHPRGQTAESLSAAANRRVAWAHSGGDLTGKRVLEIGCGRGYETWSMAANLGCDAYGVDVVEYHDWDTLENEHVHLSCRDLTLDNPFPGDFFDRVVSYTVWEHVVRPRELLEESYRILKPGGVNWLRANLWSGPQASHRYRQIFFPWPHLLFSDDVIADWDAKHGRTTSTGSAWVNKLSWAHYERYFEEVGFELRQVVFQEAEWDEEFFRRFENQLGRFPKEDLRRDFFLAVLQKPT